MIYIQENKNFKVIDINHLLALCEIGDDYKLFCEDLENLIKSKNNKDLVSKVYHVIQKKDTMNYRKKYETFIEKHKSTIQILNKYNCLSNLTVLSYDNKGDRVKNLPEDYFYQYIVEHKEDIETIKAVVLKIKSLGFNKINFGENLDFTETQYEMNVIYNSKFAFLENMEIIPTYLNGQIKYKTNNSCYRINIEWDHSCSIELNSLIFDPNRLPNEITTNYLVSIIKNLTENKMSEHSDIRDCIDLSISISDLKNKFEKMKKVYERIDKIKDNQELVNLLNQMEGILEQLQLFGVNFEKEIIDFNPSITSEIIEKEKKLYLDRRYWSSIDIY